MKLAEKLGRGAAAAGVAGLLSVSMLAGQAAPAHAILPVVPVVIGAVGATGAGAAVSAWAVAGYAALTAGVLGASFAIQQNGHVWLEGALDFFAPEVPEEKRIESPGNSNPAESDPLDNSYIWSSSFIEIAPHPTGWKVVQLQPAGAPRPVNWLQVYLHYSGTGVGTGAARPMFVVEKQCKRFDNGAMYGEVAYIKSGTLQNADGYRDANYGIGCGDNKVGELMEARVRPPSTIEKRDPAKLNQPLGSAYYNEYSGPNRDLFWRDPDATFTDPGFRATVECVKPDGTMTSLTLDSGLNDGKVSIPSCKAAGLGEVANSLSIDYIDGSRVVTPAIKALPEADQFLECDVALGKVCKLEIYIDGMPCVYGTVQCAGWVSHHRADPSRVKCFYGSREVSIGNCGILEGAYVPGGSPFTPANVDGDPGTWDDPLRVPGWVPQPAPNSPPMPDAIPNPNVNPTPLPAPSPAPGPGTDPAPGGDPAPIPTEGVNPSDNPDAGENCLGSGWSWNPVSWVMVPTQCALQWAFVPPKARVDAALRSIEPKFETRGIKPFVDPVMAGVANLGGAGCKGPAIDLSSIKLPVFFPFDACGSPMSTIASGVNSFFALSLVVQGGMSCIRGVAAAFGFNWGLGSKGTDA